MIPEYARPKRMADLIDGENLASDLELHDSGEDAQHELVLMVNYDKEKLFHWKGKASMECLK